MLLYLKATGVGIVAALTFAITWILATVLIPMWWASWRAREAGDFGFVSIGSGNILPVALVGFVFGFFWIVRRASN